MADRLVKRCGRQFAFSETHWVYLPVLLSRRDLDSKMHIWKRFSAMFVVANIQRFSDSP